MSTREFPSITSIKTYLLNQKGIGGDYHNVESGHWLIDNSIANPMSKYSEYIASRTSWGINVLGSFCVQVTASNGVTGFATGFGGPPACWLVSNHFKRFIVGEDPLDTTLTWDKMFRASKFYGRKGLTVAVISVIDLAIWDLLGKLRNEPAYKMIGGATRERLAFYSTDTLYSN
ncbi:enolase N-terminal domain-like protein [Scheffersomyces xylosifermentans]|uniref:enolase N-terminal domain-like protein n=1 Tax=Scheffersomyces xylosifermentans TaxID=1304137 RepID=UPI00315CEFC1